VDLSAPSAPLLAGSAVAGFYEGVITPDGRAAVYQLNNNIGMRALTGDTTRKVVASSKYVENQARVSPDGRWVAFVTDESGSDQVVVQPLSGPGARVQVSANGGTEPVWSRDGRRLFYRATRRFMAANVTTTPTFAVTSRDILFGDTFVTAAAPHANYDVTPDGKRLLVLEPVDDPQILIVHNWGAEMRERLSGRSHSTGETR
jgi:serine/threonine-protein kinase